MPDEPIATYRESFSRKRDFELFADRVYIRVRVGISSEVEPAFEASIPLQTLDLAPARCRVRNPNFRFFLFVLLSAVVIEAILISTSKIAPMSWESLGVGIIGMCALACMLATVRKVEVITFASTDGVHKFDVARSGRDSRSFDSFVELVSTHISNATKRNA